MVSLAFRGCTQVRGRLWSFRAIGEKYNSSHMQNGHSAAWCGNVLATIG